MNISHHGNIGAATIQQGYHFYLIKSILKSLAAFVEEYRIQILDKRPKYISDYMEKLELLFHHKSIAEER